jgi:hypothetical protein
VRFSDEFPVRYVLDRFGAGLRDCYSDTIKDGAPEHLKGLIERIQGRQKPSSNVSYRSKRGSGGPTLFSGR